MEKQFNTAGPNQPDIHYTLTPSDRINWPELSGLIDARKYFILHAPRQTGKTSLLLHLMHTINAEGKYRALYTNVEAAQAMRNDVLATGASMVQALAGAARLYWKDFPAAEQIALAILQRAPNAEAVRQTLQTWSEQSDKALLVFLDEVDSLIGDSLISLLRQIRAGYAQRPEAFPISMVLCGVRDVRDYRIHRSDGEIITGGSAFNIKSESIRLGDFTQGDVTALLQQHTTATGQAFEPAALEEIWLDTQGQPWLVNALAYQACFSDTALRDRSLTVTVEHIRQAREALILRRDTHLDQLSDKLKEDRVRRVIEPLLESAGDVSGLHPDDVQYVYDLGLIKVNRPGQISIANRIYQEVIPRELTWGHQMGINQQQAWYVTASGRLDIDKLLAAFQQFFRENSESWLQRYAYHEAGPQLLLQAFLQRIVNGGGRIAREYGLGRGRTDLLLQWPLTPQGFTGAMQQVVLELKIQHKGKAATLAAGLVQTARYADQCAADEAHLLIFDRDPAVAWEDKIYREAHRVGPRDISVWGM